MPYQPTSTFEQAAYLLKGIAHPLRMQILKLLEQTPGLSVTDLMDRLQAEQSLVSHHLTRMRRKGLVVAEREGKNAYYSLSDQRFVTIIDLILDSRQLKALLGKAARGLAT
ncbi:ArsR/SmtB family transcription factor [Fibrella forsythiae]|uniref:Winged helix-turn-helix transcriptional regulator n=1 Tax=Fibrella forsythiae TaxID=2817061 RepID=A0ABS3JTE7_9BACT|nr:metalloregulator ArsR/SmtB family transcription factor [Fibrella forsythiae]MBO0953286.1 winged helix-turn-helix transcriptional regulator [Fibrella forsythiae]